MSSTLLHPVLATAVVLLTQIIGYQAPPCPGNSTRLNDSTIFNCFALMDVEEGPVSAAVAKQKCESEYPNSYLVTLGSKAKLQSVVDFAIQEGVPKDGEAGFWTWWVRSKDAPLDPDGTLSPGNETIRKNRDLFSMPGEPSFKMLYRLWRNESQPGNALDARDEKCTAQSRLGKQPEYLGLDDYECDGAQLHYAICEI